MDMDIETEFATIDMSMEARMNDDVRQDPYVDVSSSFFLI